MSITNDKSVPSANDASSMRMAYNFASQVLKSTTEDLNTKNAQLEKKVQDLKATNNKLLQLFGDSLQHQQKQLAQNTQLAKALTTQDEQNRALRREIKELKEREDEEKPALRKRRSTGLGAIL